MLKFIAVPLFLYLGIINKPSARISYTALGDSYTICTGASTKESWPVLLTAHLNTAGIKTELVANPSVNGYSTADLIREELPVFDKSGANFVTLSTESRRKMKLLKGIMILMSGFTTVV